VTADGEKPRRAYQRSKRYPGVFRQGRTWHFVIDVGRGPDGRRQQLKRGGFPTAEAAAARRLEIRASLDEGRYVAADKVTVGEYLEQEWLPAVALRVRPTTRAQYRQLLTLHVIPRIGAVRLQELRARHLEALYGELLASGRRNGVGGLSPKTVRLTHTALRAALGEATRRARVQRNVALEVRVAPGHVEAPAWTKAQLRDFLGHAADDRLQALWLLVATTGMRRGEALALRWNDLVILRDAGERRAPGRLTVNRAITVVDNAPVATQTKTRAGRRTIALDPGTVAALERHRVRQATEREAAGEAWRDIGLVFCREDGTALHPSAVSRRFKLLGQQAGLPHSHCTGCATPTRRSRSSAASRRRW